MDCALWLNRRKIHSAAEIRGALDVASLRGYFIAGSLLDWLNEHGGEEYAAKLADLSPDDERLNEKIAEAFGGTPVPAKPLGGADGAETPPRGAAGSNIPSSYEFPSSYRVPSSYRFSGSGGLTSGFLAAFGSGGLALTSGYSAFGSFIGYGGSGGAYLGFAELWQLLGGGSFTASGFSGGSRLWEWEWEWFFRLFAGQSGSFTVSSFSSGARLWGWEWFFRLFAGQSGSFAASSLASGGLINRERLFALLANYGSFRGFGSYAGFGSGGLGSLAAPAFRVPDELPDLNGLNGLNGLDEYDRIMLATLLICPLDGFGYGIRSI